MHKMSIRLRFIIATICSHCLFRNSSNIPDANMQYFMSIDLLFNCFLLFVLPIVTAFVFSSDVPFPDGLVRFPFCKACLFPLEGWFRGLPSVLSSSLFWLLKNWLNLHERSFSVMWLSGCMLYFPPSRCVFLFWID